MHLVSVTIENVRVLRSVAWVAGEKGAGWHVIIGDNGTGKSSFLRAIALALVGPVEAIALRQDWSEWLALDSDAGQVRVDLNWDESKDWFSQKDRPPKNDYLMFGISLSRQQDGTVQLGTLGYNVDPKGYVWGGNGGWFCASYGPFRRFTGGDKDQEKLYYSNPRLARHLSVFGESVALTEALEWMQKLRFKQLENDSEGALIEPLKTFINQPGFLPYDVHLADITSRGVIFVDAAGSNVPVENLSDGYRSILSMTFELIRQLAATYGPEALFSPDGLRIVVPGVVLIDEIDAHLHPTWQRRVGRWFREHFPSVQFIVTTHSPLVCQAADVGTVFRLPQPGTDEEGQQITGVALDRLLYGSVLDAYGTGVFGEGVTRSEQSQQMLERLAALNQKELTLALSPEESNEQSRLRGVLSTSLSALPGEVD